MAFGLVERDARAANTCRDCAEKINPSWLGECERCQHIIAVGDRYHLEWLLLCAGCAREVEKERGGSYRLSSLKAHR